MSSAELWNSGIGISVRDAASIQKFWTLAASTTAIQSNLDLASVDGLAAHQDHTNTDDDDTDDCEVSFVHVAG